MSIGTDRAKACARAIVSTHETLPPTPVPDYAELAVLRDGPMKSVQVTFGAHQATDRSDALDRILATYRELAIREHGEKWDDLTLADELAEYLPRLAENSPRSCAELARDDRFLALLRKSASDPLMKRAQDDVFDRHYMTPAVEACDGSDWVEPLSLAVVYDSMIHGSWRSIRNLVRGISDERKFVEAYVATRRWHLEHAGRGSRIFRNPLLRRTTYRMATFEGLMKAGNWKLVAPFTAHGVWVREEHLTY
jgi:chitosanase